MFSEISWYFCWLYFFVEYKTDLIDDEKELAELYRTTPEREKFKVLCDIDAMITEDIDKYAKEKRNRISLERIDI